jgi:prephenate dehydrogenase
MLAPQIGIIGSGKVAQTMLRLARAAGIPIAGIYARNAALAEQLALKYDTQTVAGISALHADLILLCVSDDALPEIIAQLKPQQIALRVARASNFLHTNSSAFAIRIRVSPKAAIFWLLISLS